MGGGYQSASPLGGGIETVAHFAARGNLDLTNTCVSIIVNILSRSVPLLSNTPRADSSHIDRITIPGHRCHYCRDAKSETDGAGKVMLPRGPRRRLWMFSTPAREAFLI